MNQKFVVTFVTSLFATLLVISAVGWYLVTRPLPGRGASMANTSEMQQQGATPGQFHQLLTFAYPNRDSILSIERVETVQWSVPKEIQDHFTDFYVMFDLYDQQGNRVGSLGDGFPLSGTSYLWDIPAGLKSKLFQMYNSDGSYRGAGLDPAQTYTIHAHLQINGTRMQGCDPERSGGGDCTPTYSSADQELNAEARFYESVSEPFSFAGAGDTATQTGQTKTYTDALRGFSFSYPDTMRVETKGYGSIGTFSQPPVAFIRVTDDPDILEGYLTVSIDPDPAHSLCSIEGATPVVIQGVTFYERASADSEYPGASRDYATVRNNNCYDIRIFMFQSAGILSHAQPRWTSGENTIYGLLLPVVQSFTFTDGASAESGATEVQGLKKFTDAAFGFSFWYPASWDLEQTAVFDSTTYPDGVVKKKISLSHDQDGIQIEEFESPLRSITDATGVGACPVCVTTKYYFDTTLHEWMVTYPNGTGSGMPPGISMRADVSMNTMGGLHMFSGSRRFGSNTIVPLSARRFLVLTSDVGTDPIQRVFAKTILATDPSVATPADASVQKATLDALSEDLGN